MESDLRTLMLANAPLLALVGQRVNWGGFPQGVQSPAITMFRVSGPPGYHMQGADGLDFARVQIDVRAASPVGNDAAGFDIASPIADAVKAALSGASGITGTTDFRGIFIADERNFSEKPASEMLHRFQIDVEIWSRQTS